MRNKTNVKYNSINYLQMPNNSTKCRLFYEVSLNVYPFNKLLLNANEILKVAKKLKSTGIKYDKHTNYPIGIMFITEATARCDNGDEYVKEVGERIALTRAQAKAFEKTCKLYDELCDRLDETIMSIINMIDNNWSAANKCWDHASELGGYKED